jgi:flagellar motor component MotA
MSITQLGNVIQVNQMTPAVSSVQNAHDNRVELQNVMAQTLVQEKEKEVQDIRPAEHNQQIDPDREHQRQEADQQEKQKHPKIKEQKKSTPKDNFHLLDVVV